MTNKNDEATTNSKDNIAQVLEVDATSKRHKQVWKWLLIVVPLMVIAAVFLLKNGNSTKAMAYETAELSRGNLTVIVTATGTLEPVNQVDVGSEISGTIRDVLVDFNDRVEKGQVLARLDTDQLRAKVNKASASLELARARVKQSEATVTETRNKLRRARELAKSGMCSEEDCDAAQATYDRALADLASSHAQVTEAQASLDAEQTSLSKATIHSPIDGIVLQRKIEPGQTVAASLQTPILFTLAENLTQMELHVAIDEADIGQVTQGQPALFTVDAYPDMDFPATITEVHFAPQTVDGVVTYETLLSVDNSQHLLRPGMTATVDITVNALNQVLLVPNRALRFSPEETDTNTNKSNGSVISNLLPRPPIAKSKSKESLDKNHQQLWLLESGMPMAVTVKTGATDGKLTEIISGDVKPGQQVILDVLSQVK